MSPFQLIQHNYDGPSEMSPPTFSENFRTCIVIKKRSTCADLQRRRRSLQGLDEAKMKEEEPNGRGCERRIGRRVSVKQRGRLLSSALTADSRRHVERNCGRNSFRPSHSRRPDLVALENAALRQQLAVLKRDVKRQD